MADADADGRAGWQHVAPVLDEALMVLSEKNRNSILLRFFEGKSHADVAESLGVSEDAAKRRVSRAIEKLRKFFARKGFAVSGAVVAGLLGTQAAQAAPVEVAMACTAAGAGGAAGAGAVSAAANAIAEGAMHMMAWAKLKLVASVCAITVLAGGAGALGVRAFFAAEPAEKVLLGFEAAEVERWAARIDESARGREVCLKPPDGSPESPYKGIWQHEHFTASSESSSEGEYALVYACSLDETDPDETMKPKVVLNTFGWFSKVFPEDWSAYDLLRLDVRCRDADAKLRVAFEDDEITPPCERTFAVPADRWVTLEVDLRMAAEARGLDLGTMVNLWLFLDEVSRPATLYVDNIRLAKRDVLAPLQVLRDSSAPHHRSAPKSNILPQTREMPSFGGPRKPVPSFPPPVLRKGTARPAASVPVVISLPEENASLSFNKDVGIAAYDRTNILVAYYAGGWCSVRAITTTDGGRTWRNLRGKPGRGTAVTAHGPASCGGGGTSAGDLLMFTTGLNRKDGVFADRLFFRKVAFNGRGWDISGNIFVDDDLRGITSGPKVLRLASGRLWGVWGHHGRRAITGIHAKYSDDRGATWRAWHGDEGRVAAVPGSYDDRLNNSFGRAVWLVPYDGHVACLWPKRTKTKSGRISEVVMSIFDGTAWSPYSVVGAGMPTSVITRGSNEIFVCLSRGGVLRWDGRAWSKENVPKVFKGRFALSGRKLFLFSWDKKNRHAQPRKITYRERVGATWSGPKELVTAKTPLLDFIVQPYSPDGFVPLAWICCKDDRKVYAPPTEKKIYLQLVPTK